MITNRRKISNEGHRKEDKKTPNVPHEALRTRLKSPCQGPVSATAWGRRWDSLDSVQAQVHVAVGQLDLQNLIAGGPSLVEEPFEDHRHTDRATLSVEAGHKGRCFLDPLEDRIEERCCLLDHVEHPAYAEATSGGDRGSWSVGLETCDHPQVEDRLGEVSYDR